MSAAAARAEASASAASKGSKQNLKTNSLKPTAKSNSCVRVTLWIAFISIAVPLVAAWVVSGVRFAFTSSDHYYERKDAV